MKRSLLIVLLLIVQSVGRAQTAENDPDAARFDQEIAQFQQWDAKFMYVFIKPSSSHWSYWSAMKSANQRIKTYNHEHLRLYYVIWRLLC